MQPSQDKVANNIYTIEKNLERTVRKNYAKSIIHKEYLELILRELDSEKEDNLCVKQSQIRHAQCDQSPLLNKFSVLVENVASLEKNMGFLKEELENFIIQSFSEKEALRRIGWEKEYEMKQNYLAETETIKKELEAVDAECSKAEQALENQILLEAATKHARLSEIKNSLQRQITEKNTELSCLQNRFKELTREVDTFKYNYSNPSKTSKKTPTNVMQFRPDSPDKDHQSIFRSKRVRRDTAKGAEYKANNQRTSTSDNLNSNAVKVNKSNQQNLNMETNALLESDYAEFERNFDFYEQQNRILKINPYNIEVKLENSLDNVPTNQSPSKKTSNQNKDDSEMADESCFLEEMIKQSDSFDSSTEAQRRIPKVYMGKRRRTFTHTRKAK